MRWRSEAAQPGGSGDASPALGRAAERVVEYKVDNNPDPAHFQWSTGLLIGLDTQDAYAPEDYQASVKPPAAQARQAVMSFHRAGCPGSASRVSFSTRANTYVDVLLDSDDTGDHGCGWDRAVRARVRCHGQSRRVGRCTVALKEDVVGWYERWFSGREPDSAITRDRADTFDLQSPAVRGNSDENDCTTPDA